MRQAGSLAAAGMYALTHHRALLEKTHAHAKHLGQSLAAKGFVIDLERVQSNMVYITLENAPAHLERWADEYGNLYRFRMGPRSIVVTSDADTIKRMFR